MSLDARKRAETIAALQSTEWDLLVIGGGITGVGIALDAATRGMKVALVEMRDFAAGTSSRSTKLIHGGLRYLKQLEFRLVREVGTERAILYRNAGHIVVPEKMLLPIVKGGTFGHFGLRWGLWLYDRLARVAKHERRKMLTREEAAEMEPWLKVGGLLSAGLYSEYRTDDARLTVEVIKTAVAKGATALNYAKVEQLCYNQKGKIVGAKVRDGVEGEQFEVKARHVVNAAGPWVDGIRQLDRSLEGKRLHHTKGVHLVVAAAHLPIQQAIYFDVGDGRMIFAIPRGPWTYFGTTDTNYNGLLDHPTVTAADADYLLAAVNRMFPRANLDRSHIESSWAGIRPLIHKAGKSPSQLSRKDELFFSPTGLITIAGGKLTGFRKMAEKVVNVVAKRMRKEGENAAIGPCITDRIVMSGFEFASSNDAEGSVYRLSLKYAMPSKEVDWLNTLFGSNVETILLRANGRDSLSILRGTLLYAIENEGVVCLSDFFVRRTAMLYFGRKWIEASLPTAKAVFAEVFGEDYDPDPGMVFANEYKQAVTFE
ncbi:MAG TPA: glycerol-3-phosphate dehydrogenase/oxidase [Bacteroidia bacterium]|nr:glycerol-3-phosphate dehydrogenase/oxidase [Bacteroidia bacterium]